MRTNPSLLTYSKSILLFSMQSKTESSSSINLTTKSTNAIHLVVTTLVVIVLVSPAIISLTQQNMAVALDIGVIAEGRLHSAHTGVMIDNIRSVPVRVVDSNCRP